MEEEVQRLEAELEGLRQAMATRATIEQAKGIIMAATGLDPDGAFRVLAEQSQHQNRKVHDVADEVVQATVRQPAGDTSSSTGSSGSASTKISTA